MRATHKANLFILLSLLIAVAAIAVPSYLYYQWEQNHFKSDKYFELNSIAELKVKQIADWRKERHSDINYLFNHPFIPELLASAQQSKTFSLAKRQLFNIMLPMYKNHRYQSIQVFDARGERLFAIPDFAETHYLEIKKVFEETKKAGRPVVSDLQMHEDQIVMYLASAFLNSNNSVIGYIVLYINPFIELYPLIQYWPVLSHTSECLLVEREGNNVLCLNELRHKTGAALNLRLPISDERSPVAMAVRGVEGVVEGIDYRSVEVLAAIKKIPHSPWFIVVKIDNEEIFASLKERKWLIIIIDVLMIFSISLFVLSIIYRRQLNHKQLLLNAELEKKALVKNFDHLFKYANDIIILTNDNWKIIEANNKAFEVYGYSKLELYELRFPELQPLEIRKEFHQLNEEEIRKTGHTIFETIHSKKDGTQINVETSIRQIEIEGRNYCQAIIRDITERKRAEKALNMSEEKYRKLHESLMDGYVLTDMEGHIKEFNEVYRKMLGYDESELINITYQDLTPEKWHLFEGDIIKNQILPMGYSDVYEKEYINKDGIIFPVELRVFLMRDEKGNLKVCGLSCEILLKENV